MSASPDDNQRIPCRYCAAPLAAADVNVQLAIAKCASCHAVYSLADEARLRGESPVEGKLKTAMPKNFQVEKLDGVLTITRTWFTPGVIFALVFVVFWGVVTVGFLANAKGLGSAFLIQMFFGGVTLALGYWTLAHMFNKTIITVGGGQLMVRHGPIPYPGNLELPSSELAQLWCVEHIRRTKKSYSYSYELHARTKEGVDRTLMRDLPDAAQAIYVEQEVERYLRIADRRMPGEH